MFRKVCEFKMHRDLQETLYEKYDKLFRQRNLSPSETCMCWGIAIGDGWYDIIDELCYRIQTYVVHHNIKQPEFSQIKSKFGKLVIYMDDEDDYIRGLISMACGFACRVDEKKKSKNWRSG